MSATLKDLLKNKIGYRNPNFQGSGEKNCYDVIRFEIESLGNLDILYTMSELYNLDFSEYLYEDDGEEYAMEDCIVDLVTFITNFLEEKFSTTKENISVIWLTSKEGVEKLYSYNEDTEIAEFSIGENWMPISDIGMDGILFAYKE